MKTIYLKHYGFVISDSELGQKIFDDIISALDEFNFLTIDFDEIISMATFCSKQIFGKLYLKLSSKVFFERVRIANATNEMRIVVRLGIEKALEDQ
ncbi:DUF4325 domain-containing protein [Spirosoma sp. HMF4905]|uniref:DUF4325 domain-containing protein n=1 Tax=Spirosoma arboris TaxID=2682092 RepID=A0A7K1SIK0_9BACT|nr:DUF4325 domain-containing protein [Spirosoma arboris]MVM33649.1 DUF4325 domain-containing protein [Spirosoma arboris]